MLEVFKQITKDFNVEIEFYAEVQNKKLTVSTHSIEVLVPTDRLEKISAKELREIQNKLEDGCSGYTLGYEIKCANVIEEENYDYDWDDNPVTFTSLEDYIFVENYNDGKTYTVSLPNTKGTWYGHINVTKGNVTLEYEDNQLKIGSKDDVDTLNKELGTNYTFESPEQINDEIAKTISDIRKTLPVVDTYQNSIMPSKFRRIGVRANRFLTFHHSGRKENDIRLVLTLNGPNIDYDVINKENEHLKALHGLFPGDLTIISTNGFDIPASPEYFERWRYRPVGTNVRPWGKARTGNVFMEHYFENFFECDFIRTYPNTGSGIEFKLSLDNGKVDHVEVVGMFNNLILCFNESNELVCSINNLKLAKSTEDIKNAVNSMLSDLLD